MSGLLAPAVVVHLAFAAGAMTLRRRPRASHRLAVAGAAVHLGLALVLLARVQAHGIQTAAMGGWPAPFGISLAADLLGALMVVITGLIGLSVAVYARRDIDNQAVRRGFYPLLHTLLASISGAFLTADLFNLYVWFEVMLMSSFGLLVLGQTRAQLDGGVKYVVINLVATLLFLTALGLVYALTGTLNMADLHVKLARVEAGGLRPAVAMLFVAAFGIKAGLFPLYFWLRAAYPTPPPPPAC